MIKNLTYLFISIVLTFSLSVRSQNCLLEQEWQLDAISDNCEDYYEAWLESFDTEEAFVKIFKEDDNFRIFLINVLDGMIDHPASLTIWKRFGLINQDFEMLSLLSIEDSLKMTGFRIIIEDALAGGDVAYVLSNAGYLARDVHKKYPKLLQNPYYFLSVATDFVDLNMPTTSRIRRLEEILKLDIDRVWKAIAYEELATLHGFSSKDLQIKMLKKCANLFPEKNITNIEFSCSLNLAYTYHNYKKKVDAQSIYSSIAETLDLDLNNLNMSQILSNFLSYERGEDVSPSEFKIIWAQYNIAFNYIFTFDQLSEKRDQLLSSLYLAAIEQSDIFNKETDRALLLYGDYADHLLGHGRYEEAKKVYRGYTALTESRLEDEEWYLIMNSDPSYDTVLATFTELNSCMQTMVCERMSDIEDLHNLSRKYLDYFIGSDKFMEAFYSLNQSFIDVLNAKEAESESNLQKSYDLIVNSSNYGYTNRVLRKLFYHELIKQKKRLTELGININFSYLDVLELETLFTIQDELKESKITNIRSNIDNLIRSYQIKRNEYSEIENIILNTGSITNDDAEKLNKLESEIISLRSSILESNEKISLFLNSTFNKDEVMSTINSETVIVRFDFLFQSGLALVISKSGEEIVELEIGTKDLHPLINSVLDMTEKDGIELALKPFNLLNSNEIYKKVYQPVLNKFSKTKELLIYKSNDLMRVPPQIIVKKIFNGKNSLEWEKYRKSRWMSDDYIIASYNPSPNNNSSENKANNFLGFGNPIYSDLVELEPLPSTENELVNLAILSGSDANGLFLREKATKQNFISKLSESYERLVISTHAVSADSEVKNNEPAIVFGGDDPFLFASEIAQLDINADWVILASCNTGKSVKSQSDSVYSLAHAFLVAGADSVLLSNWEVDTNLSNKLTETIFRNTWLDKDIAKHEALNNASRSIRMDPRNLRYSHPYFWGTYNLVYSRL